MLLSSKISRRGQEVVAARYVKFRAWPSQGRPRTASRDRALGHVPEMRRSSRSRSPQRIPIRASSATLLSKWRSTPPHSQAASAACSLMVFTLPDEHDPSPCVCYRKWQHCQPCPRNGHDLPCCWQFERDRGRALAHRLASCRFAHGAFGAAGALGARLKRARPCCHSQRAQRDQVADPCACSLLALSAGSLYIPDGL
jgi:hypothetical protein